MFIEYHQNLANLQVLQPPTISAERELLLYSMVWLFYHTPIYLSTSLWYTYFHFGIPCCISTPSPWLQPPFQSSDKHTPSSNTGDVFFSLHSPVKLTQTPSKRRSLHMQLAQARVVVVVVVVVCQTRGGCWWAMTHGCPATGIPPQARLRPNILTPFESISLSSYGQNNTEPPITPGQWVLCAVCKHTQLRMTLKSMVHLSALLILGSWLEVWTGNVVCTQHFINNSYIWNLWEEMITVCHTVWLSFTFKMAFIPIRFLRFQSSLSLGSDVIKGKLPTACQSVPPVL